MVKAKRKHLAAVVVNSTSSQSSIGNPLNFVDSDISAEDNWVVVKKQRVNIFIPSLPGTQPPEQTQLPENRSMSANIPTQLPDENPSKVSLAEGNEEPSCLSPKTDVLSAQAAHCYADSVVETMKPNKSSPQKMNREHRVEHRVTTLKALHKEKANTMPKTSTNLNPFKPFERSGLFALKNMAGGTTFHDKMMKASNLEKKIIGAGGLDRWLSSLGLEQFSRIFDGRKISKLQLVNLSMKKLKDMGAHAVGPRRKLIHAIECAVLF